ncbi:MAG: tyrosine/serine/threonine protein phosphatase pps1 [Phylliscum demangeonii]|nr:MAG: tyrosine/serine/threonine protein phosphatase pps1 [Phylliscum demangeonii]
MAALVASPLQAQPPPSSTNATATRLRKSPTPVSVPLSSSTRHLDTLSPGRAPDPSRAEPAPSCVPASSPQTSSLLYPPDGYDRLLSSPAIYAIDAQGLAAALQHLSAQPLPEPNEVFPWLHGLHPRNHVQLNFLLGRRRSVRKAPKCLRSVTIVKCGGDLTRSTIKGSVAPAELLHHPPGTPPAFRELDPAEGFSVRNFHIQAGKMATVSDLIVYGDATASAADLLELAQQLAAAQKIQRMQEHPGLKRPVLFNTFILSTAFPDLEARHPELVATNAAGDTSPSAIAFLQHERAEMLKMSRPSEIAKNVWLGPSPTTDPDPTFDILLEASDRTPTPEPSLLMRIRDAPAEPREVACIEVPSSGSLLPSECSPVDMSHLLDLCRWIHELSDPCASRDPAAATEPVEGDGARPRRFLIHCADGYTETSLLALTYLMYVGGIPVHDAWLHLHREKQRDFFAYPADVALLRRFQPHILEASPRARAMDAVPACAWLGRMDGSLPSRILPDLYLGNLGHAKNHALLQALGIDRVLSVGELLPWPIAVRDRWGPEKLLWVEGVQDNGVDGLTDEFTRCLDFIETGRRQGSVTLVHCRVGVSRSATICIAEVMKTVGLSFPRAYCFVRARRLNVIIQPHLRFAYELLKWEESRQTQQGHPIQRELDWACIARQIALLNEPYAQ